MPKLLFSAHDQEADTGVADDVDNDLFQTHVLGLHRSKDRISILRDFNLATADDQYGQWARGRSDGIIALDDWPGGVDA
jgi:hypothetical protein